MKHVETNPYGNPEAAARKLVEVAAATPAAQDGRIYIEQINAPFTTLLNGSRGYPEFATVCVMQLKRAGSNFTRAAPTSR